MKVLVTGSTGSIGPAIVSELEKEHKLTLFTRRQVETKHRLVLGDLTAPEDCRRAVEGMEAVVHLAAISEPSPQAFSINTTSTYYLLDAARSQGVERVIMASTNAVYGHCFPISDRPFRVEFLPLDETHPCRPEDNYGLSKRLCEEMLAIYSHTWGIRTAALRLNWVWRPEKEIKQRQESPEMFDVAQRARIFWAYVHIHDVAQAFRLALEAPDLPDHGVYNVSAADTMAEEDTAELLARFYPDVPVKATLPGRASLFDWSCANQAFGFTPRYSWRD